MSPRGRRQPATDVHKPKAHAAPDPVVVRQETPAPADMPGLTAAGNPGLESQINIPVGPELSAGFVARHLDIQMPMHHARLFKRIFNALHQGHYRLAKGGHVDRLPQAMLWILDQIAIGLGAPSQPSLPMGDFRPAELPVPNGGWLAEQCEQFMTNVLTSLAPEGVRAEEWVREKCEVVVIGDTQAVMVDGVPVGQFRAVIEETRISYDFERIEV